MYTRSLRGYGEWFSQGFLNPVEKICTISGIVEFTALLPEGTTPEPLVP